MDFRFDFDVVYERKSNELAISQRASDLTIRNPSFDASEKTPRKAGARGPEWSDLSDR
jgi:hypothetical protein